MLSRAGAQPHAQHLDRHHRQQVRQVATLQRRRSANAAMDAIRDRQRRHVDVVADGVGVDDPELVVVLQESSKAAADIGRMRAAENLERRHLDRRHGQP